ncbi:MAG: L-histidine N(alpha)-methyltransferase [Myxococcota bacterium]
MSTSENQSFQPDVQFLRDVQEGLAASPKTLPCKYLYDERGSQLFEEITSLDEYYPTRADLEATTTNVEAIVSRVGPGVRLVELGSGSSTKTRVLLDHLPDIAAYIPVEISSDALDESVTALREAYPDLEVLPLRADYTRPLTLPTPSRPFQKTVVYYPGSTIGNFHPKDAIAFLRRLREVVISDQNTAGDGGMLIGVDLKKDKAQLERAYNDAQGVTAAFNLNLLTRINRELGTEIPVADFRHEARYDEGLGRIEMHLVSERAQTIDIGDQTFAFEAGETIRTEESYKYSREEFARVAEEAGFNVDAFWTDTRGRFSLQYLLARPM